MTSQSALPHSPTRPLSTPACIAALRGVTSGADEQVCAVVGVLENRTVHAVAKSRAAFVQIASCG